MKNFYKKLLAIVMACCVLLSLAACSGETNSETGSGNETQAPAALDRYDYIIDMSGNQVEITIAQNLKSVKAEIKSMGLEFTSYCEVKGNVLTLTEYVDGNEQVWTGIAAASYTLNADGTAVPAEASTESDASAESDAGLERYDYVIDMKGNQVEVTIAQNLKSLKAEIKSMGLEFTSYCEVSGNVLKLTEYVDGNEQVWTGIAASSYTLNADGTAVPVE